MAGEDSGFLNDLKEGIFEKLKLLNANEYIKEMIGISNILQCPIEQLVYLHCMYETVCGCTTIAVLSKNEKNLILGRTLDWLDINEQIYGLTIDIKVINSSM